MKITCPVCHEPLPPDPSRPQQEVRWCPVCGCYRARSSTRRADHPTGCGCLRCLEET